MKQDFILATVFAGLLWVGLLFNHQFNPAWLRLQRLDQSECMHA